jgi:hypothetical protein
MPAVSRRLANFLVIRRGERSRREPLQFLPRLASQSKQPAPFVAGYIVLLQQFIAMQNDAALAFDQEGAHGADIRLAVPRRRRPVCELEHFSLDAFSAIRSRGPRRTTG